MSVFLDTIGSQRARIAHMVDVFDEQLADLRNPAGDPDYHLLREIARYFGHYPTSVHYPFEERLYAHLASVRPELSAKSDALRRSHERHASLARNVFALLDGACSGHLVPRDRLLQAATDYLALQREHMIPQTEELFALASAALGEADIDAIRHTCDAHTDPRVRAKIEDEFTRMEEAIVEETSAAA